MCNTCMHYARQGRAGSFETDFGHRCNHVDTVKVDCLQDAYREGAGGILELLLQRVYMICIHVRVTKHMYQLACSQPAHLRNAIKPSPHTDNDAPPNWSMHGSGDATQAGSMKSRLQKGV